MNKLKIVLVLLISACSKSSVPSPPVPAPPVPVVPSKELNIKAVDASFIPEIRSSGVVTKNRLGQPEDMLTTLKNEGVNTIRLRLWKDPATLHSGFNEVKTFAQKIKSKGLKVWITVHYSDTWADPGAQLKPAAWNGASYAQLKDSVYNYTKKIVTEMNPDYIQIGNEINGGLIWPEGRSSNLVQMKELIAQGIRAVRDQSPQTKIMLHNAGIDNAAFFYTNIGALDYDIIALSYYPIWHGKNLNQLQTTLNTLSAQFNKDIVIAETAYPFTFGWNDYTNNIIGLDNQILPEFSATEQGQKDFLTRLKTIVTNSPKGTGLCYWGAEWVAFKGPQSTKGSSWENQALWDFNYKALPAMGVFKN
ncbi:MAG: glycosyl hydrolase 53 family protein [Gloeobacteraceae cyanobacterium ES-bin-316]|nr:glycosyl hydrolase 53 family protein [Ferruginibacter sp.]